MTESVRKLKPGDVLVMEAVRVSELGAFLDAGTGSTSDDILLHKGQQSCQVKVGDKVKVFLYSDPQKRLAASMKVPQVEIGGVCRGKVLQTTEHGAFVDIGAERGILLPFAEMQEKVIAGDMPWVKLYRDKSGRLAVTMNVADVLRKMASPATDVSVGDILQGYVYAFNEEGALLFTADNHLAFLHNSETSRKVRIGEELEVRVTYVRDDGRLNVSLRPVKEVAMDIDAQNILAALQQANGVLPYSDATSPEIIKDKFGISKKAFKRALGHLMKEGLIEQQDGKTRLLKTRDS